MIYLLLESFPAESRCSSSDIKVCRSCGRSPSLRLETGVTEAISLVAIVYCLQALEYRSMHALSEYIK